MLIKKKENNCLLMNFKKRKISEVSKYKLDGSKKVTLEKQKLKRARNPSQFAKTQVLHLTLSVSKTTLFF